MRQKLWNPGNNVNYRSHAFSFPWPTQLPLFAIIGEAPEEVDRFCVWLRERKLAETDRRWRFLAMGPWASHVNLFEPQLSLTCRRKCHNKELSENEGDPKCMLPSTAPGRLRLPKMAASPSCRAPPLASRPRHLCLLTDQCICRDLHIMLVSPPSYVCQPVPFTRHPETAQEPAPCILCMLFLSGYGRCWALCGFSVTWRKPYVRITFFQQ